MVSTGGVASAAATASEEGVDGLLFEACHEVLAKLELFRIVLGYTGKGHFCFVASASKQWKARYMALYPAVETAYSSVVSSVECLNWATSQQRLELSAKLFKAAARHGDVEVCKALHSKDCPWNERGMNMCHAAAFNRKHGLSVLKWLRSEDLPGKEPCPWYDDGSVMSGMAAEEGQLEMLKWLMSDDGNAQVDSGSWADACEGGHVPVVAWLFEHRPTRALLGENEDGEWRRGAFCAARGGRLEVLQFLHANARDLCDWNAEVCFNAVAHGKSLAVLKWLRSEEVQCEWDEESCPQVIRDSVFEYEGWDIDAKAFEEMKEWVHANGRPCDCQD